MYGENFFLFISNSNEPFPCFNKKKFKDIEEKQINTTIFHYYKFHECVYLTINMKVRRYCYFLFLFKETSSNFFFNE